MPENEFFQQPDLIVLHDGQQHGPLLAGETAGTGQKRGTPVQMRQDVFTDCGVLRGNDQHHFPLVEDGRNVVHHLGVHKNHDQRIQHAVRIIHGKGQYKQRDVVQQAELPDADAIPLVQGDGNDGQPAIAADGMQYDAEPEPADAARGDACENRIGDVDGHVQILRGHGDHGQPVQAVQNETPPHEQPARNKDRNVEQHIPHGRAQGFRHVIDQKRRPEYAAGNEHMGNGDGFHAECEQAASEGQQKEIPGNAPRKGTNGS